MQACDAAGSGHAAKQGAGNCHGISTACYAATMKVSAGTVANAAAWGVIVLLIGAAVLMVNRLGFLGLLLLGSATWLVCIRAELDQDAPTWGMEVFKARMGERRSPEQHAAMLEERRAFTSPLRFYRRCGMVLAAIGAAGFIWQQWGP